jgi:sugar lactone lactonase YvrE
MNSLKIASLVCTFALLHQASASTVITANLPANTAIININATQHGAQNHDPNYAHWYQPFSTDGAASLLRYRVLAGTYRFRVIDSSDAAQLFPDLTAAQKSEVFTAWRSNSAENWDDRYLIFPAAAETDSSVPSIIIEGGGLDFSSATEAYEDAKGHGYWSATRTFEAPENLIFTVADWALQDNAGGVSILVSPVETNALVFRPQDSFTLDQNPSGPWSYGWSTTRGSTFTKYAYHYALNPPPTAVRWTIADENNIFPFLNFDTQWQANGNPPAVGFHPGPSGENSVLRWTSPVAGRLRIAATFADGHPGGGATTDVAILHNGTELASGAINYPTQVTTLLTASTSVAIGDTLDFTVGYGNGSYNSDSTTLQLEIQASSGPELTFSTVAGLPGNEGFANGFGGIARFAAPQGLALDRKGNVFVADTGNHAIRKITPSGFVTTIAGQAGQKGSADGTGPDARFNSPVGIAFDRLGRLFVVDNNNHTVRMLVEENGKWIVSTIAGRPGTSGSNNGRGDQATFYYPTGLAVDSRGNLFVGDLDNNTIRKVTYGEGNWTVTTFAGSPGNVGSTDGPGTEARFNTFAPTSESPASMEVGIDRWDNLYVTDNNNHTIRKITPDGTVSTLAGKAGVSGYADGKGSDARFLYPSGVVVDAGGNVIVADFGNNVLRRITPDGDVTTVAGLPGTPGYADGPANDARFDDAPLHWPHQLAMDATGAIYFTDFKYDTIRKATPGVIYANNFESSAGTEWSPSRVDLTPNDARHFLGQFGGGDVATLSLANLPPHEWLTVSLDLFVIRTWDGNYPAYGPDVWDLSVIGGANLLHTSFSGATPDNPVYEEAHQSFPGNHPNGDYPARTGAVESNTLGFVAGPYGVMDSVYHLTFTFPHHEAALALRFAGMGLQSVDDESWGLDNVEVRLATPNAVPAPAGLVAWWRAEGDAKDVLGRNDGALLNGTTFETGEVGQSFKLNGVDNFVQVKNPVGLPLGNAPRTVELWFKVGKDLIASTESSLVQYGTPQDGEMFGLLTTLNNPGKLNFYGQGQFSNDLDGVTPLLQNVWYHGAVTYDGSTVRLYLNGRLESSRTANLNTVLNENGLTIGYRSPTQLWTGDLDEVSIYDRALSADEIEGIYEAGTAGKLPPPKAVPAPAGLVGWWRAEGDVKDAAGGNDGVLLDGTDFDAGEVGRGFRFRQGTADSISIPASASLDVGAGAGFTIETWINPESISIAQPIIEWNNGSGLFGLQLWIQPGGQLFANVIEQGGVYHIIAGAIGQVEVGMFQHVGVSYNHSSGIAQLYYNGSVVAQSSLRAVRPETSFGIYLGRRPSGPIGPEGDLGGILDELSVYNRELTRDEMRAIYEAGSAGKIVNHAPVLEGIGEQTVAELSALELVVRATDPDAAQTLTFALDQAADGMEIDTGNGRISWTPSEEQGPGKYHVVARVTDNGLPPLHTAVEFDVEVIEINAAPYLLIPELGRAVAEQQFFFRASATDADIPVQRLKFSLGADAPAGASISESDGLFTWTPPQPGEFKFTVMVSDGVATKSQEITVVVDIPPPSIEEPALYYGFKVKGWIGTTYEVQASANAEGPTWETVDALTLQEREELWVDTRLPARENHFFYRVRQKP